MKSKKEKWVHKMFMENVPICCEVCGGKLKRIDVGLYECIACQHQELDDFGKIKAYLAKQGVASAYDIHLATGVEVEVIEYFLKDGRLEIPEGSKLYIKCEKCGCSLRYGRYCEACARQMKMGLTEAFRESIGAKPRITINEIGSRKGRMYTYGDDNSN